ncbi:hypothetical protein GGS20DRAFT_585130 [Poronia punctata]|nr:hypothetical protein GGS20DRAFT_585130 [Poronia punctata]
MPGGREQILPFSDRFLKVYISSRPDWDISPRFLDKPNSEIAAIDSNQDIKKYIGRGTIKYENGSGYIPGPTGGDHQCPSPQMSRNRVFLQTNHILDLETESTIRDRLGKLPSGDKKGYDEIFVQIKTRHKATLPSGRGLSNERQKTVFDVSLTNED